MPVEDNVRVALADLRLVLPELRRTAGISVDTYDLLSRCVSVVGTDGEKSFLETYYGLKDISAIVNLVDGMLRRYNP